MLSARAPFRSVLWVALLAWIAVGIWSGRALGQQVTQNPHWSKDACGVCHAGAVGKVAPEVVTPMCVSCHDGVHSIDEAHPVGRLMTDRLSNPGWPTIDRKVECLTCHDVKQQCDRTVERPEVNAAFLRQASAGAAGSPAFCANCHRDEETPKFNPHRMLESDLHTPVQAKCQVCHARDVDGTSGVRTADAGLRADQVTLCKSCHPKHRDISPIGHVLATIPADMLTYMRAREITGLLNTPGQDLIKQLESQNAKPTLMVPDAQGRVVCSTCHNPHQQGTFPAGTVLDDRSLRLRKDHLITPVRGELFCRHCHNL